MCVAIPCKVISTNGLIALVDAGGAQKEVSAALLDDLSVGEYVLVHAGFAIQKVQKEYAEETIKIYNETLEQIAGHYRANPEEEEDE